MGMFFNNLHIRKNEEYNHDKLKQMLIEGMEKKGYTLLESGREAEASVVIYSPKKSEWVSVASDCFVFSTAEDTKAAAFPISEKFGADVLVAACFDSDYLMMNLINAADGTDGWVNVGSMCGMKLPRRTSIAPWKGKVTDIEKFKAIIKEKNIFAEDAFYGCAELLGMVTEQCALETDNTDWLEEGTFTRLCFSLPEDTQNELPRLTFKHFGLMPCKVDESRCEFVVNKGGRSKGVGVMFVGDYIEDDQLTFENVTLESDLDNHKHTITPIQLEKRKNALGQTVLYWEDKNFHIPPAVDPSILGKRYDDLEYKRTFGVRFTVRGNPRKVLDVKFFIIPLENSREGSACWYCYMSSGTKERYIEEYNKRWKKFPDRQLNPEDYDL